MSERAAFLAAAEKKSAEHQAHVLKFAEVTAENTVVVKRMTETIEDLIGEVRGMKDGLTRLTDRVDRIDRRSG